MKKNASPCLFRAKNVWLKQGVKFETLLKHKRQPARRRLVFSGIGIALSMSLIFLSSCNKNVLDYSFPGYEKGKVLMVQSQDSRSSFTVIQLDEPWKMYFGASYSGLKSAQTDIPVEFALKNDLIAAYNDAHGTNYEPLPEGSYTVSGLKTQIPRGQSTTDSLSISIFGKKLDRTKKYLFPISIVSAGTEEINKDMQTAWFRVDQVSRNETDVTGDATLSVSAENTGNQNENSSKVIDNNNDTKFFTGGYEPGLWLQLQFADPVAVSVYTLTSGNDAHDRDPKSWEFQASNDGTNWTALDTQTDITFSDYKQTRRFEFVNTTTYKYYRLVVTEKYGDGTAFQLSEWRVITVKY